MFVHSIWKLRLYYIYIFANIFLSILTIHTHLIFIHGSVFLFFWVEFGDISYSNKKLKRNNSVCVCVLKYKILITYTIYRVKCYVEFLHKKFMRTKTTSKSCNITFREKGERERGAILGIFNFLGIICLSPLAI